MAAYEYGFTLTPGRSSRARFLAIACAAVVAVCVLSSTVVIRELVATQPARAATAASAPIITTAAPAQRVTTTPVVTTVRTWALEPRWWPGQIRQMVRPTATVPDSELTFTKGYQLRLAARQATQPASVPAPIVAAAPSAESQSRRTASTVRKPSTLARTETPIVHPVPATRVDPPADPFARFDGNGALAYDEQHARGRGFVQFRPAPPPRGLFGTLY